jgi:soluble lytic murein transglycosylase-like protein
VAEHHVADPLAVRGDQSITVKLFAEDGKARTACFEKTFCIGRGSQADFALDDPKVSQRHVRVFRDESGWWVRDLGSTNGTYLNDEQVLEARISKRSTLRLGAGGPLLIISLPAAHKSGRPAQGLRGLPGRLTTVLSQYSPSLAAARRRVGTMTLLQGIVGRARQQDRRRFAVFAAVVVALLLITTVFAVRSHRRNRGLVAVASGLFYQMKALELQIARLDRAVAGGTDEARLAQVQRQRQSHAQLQTQYDLLVDELGVLRGLDARKRLIYKVARMFGECELSMPEGFVSEVERYIRVWQRTSRLPDAMHRIAKNGLGRRIGVAMLRAHLPPQLLYVALAESDYRPRAVGPPTRYGIAKGMWQFIPSTAHQFGLRTGPLVDLRRYDPRDERFDVEQATDAAVSYLRYIYDTEAQASGLLVIAAYNWGHNAVRRRIRAMPDTPTERNFWQLLRRYDVPRETRNYVMSIMAAAVIGEDPRLFGFGFDSLAQAALAALGTDGRPPLAAAGSRSTRRAATLNE